MGFVEDFFDNFEWDGVYSGDDRNEAVITDIVVTNVKGREVDFKIKGKEADNFFPGADPDKWVSRFSLNIKTDQDTILRTLTNDFSFEDFTNKVEFTKKSSLVEQAFEEFGEKGGGTLEQLEEPEAFPIDFLQRALISAGVSFGARPNQLKRAAKQNINQLEEFWTRNVINQEQRRQQRTLDENKLKSAGELRGLGGSIQGIGTAGSTQLGGQKLGSTPEREARHVELG